MYTNKFIDDCQRKVHLNNKHKQPLSSIAGMILSWVLRNGKDPTVLSTACRYAAAAAHPNPTA